MNKYNVSYRDENTGKLKYKVIEAKTSTAALIRFKRMTGIKGIVAKYKPTKKEKLQWAAAAKKPVKFATNFDGRGYSVSYDGARGG